MGPYLSVRSLITTLVSLALEASNFNQSPDLNTLKQNISFQKKKREDLNKKQWQRNKTSRKISNRSIRMSGKRGR